jgi:hypothetical protein
MSELPTQDDSDFNKIIVCGDYDGDVKAIVDNLNSLVWDVQWAVKRSRVPEGGARRETIVPKGEYEVWLRPSADIFTLSDGRRCFANDADESFIEQWEAEKGEPGVFDQVVCTLGELSALISPHLNKGTIEFVAVRAWGGMIDHERLLVRSDGSAEYHWCNSRNFKYVYGGAITDSEYYEPESSKGARRRMPSRPGESRCKSADRQKVSHKM